MRPQVAAAVLLAGALALALMWWVRGWVDPGPSSPPNPPAADPGPAPQPGSPTPLPVATHDPAPSAPAVVPRPETNLAGANEAQQEGSTTNAAQEAYVRTRVSALEDLSMQDDAASLQTILSELANASPTIRAAALEATIQFGSRDAIPRLKELAAATEDPKEKLALIEAAEILELPSLTEFRARMKLKKTVPPAGTPDPPKPPAP